MLNMSPNKLYPMIKRLGISQSVLSHEMGYSKIHISRVMNGHNKSEKKIHKLLVAAVANRAKIKKKDYDQLVEMLNGTDWESYLP